MFSLSLILILIPFPYVCLWFMVFLCFCFLLLFITPNRSHPLRYYWLIQSFDNPLAPYPTMIRPTVHNTHTRRGPSMTCNASGYSITISTFSHHQQLFRICSKLPESTAKTTTYTKLTQLQLLFGIAHRDGENTCMISIVSKSFFFISVFFENPHNLWS